MSKTIFSKGIDVSKWQGVINWQAVKNEGVQFALIRAGYGDTISYPDQIDEQFQRNYTECKKVGLPVGAYWYSYATTIESAKREAQSCLKLLAGKQFEYPIYYDVEEMRIFNSGLTNEIIQAFCTELENAGYFVGVYIFRSAVQSYLNDRTRTRYTLAIAEYDNKLNYNDSYDIWQYSSTEKINGIQTAVDGDYCYTDFPTIIKQRGKNGYTAKTGVIIADIGDTFTHAGKVYKVQPRTGVNVSFEGVRNYEVY